MQRRLLRSGPLDEDEWAVMRLHPHYAYTLLKPIPFLQPALAIPYGHHERWDCSSYTRGLRREEIPMAVRLFAVADVYDALTYIEKQAGIQLDPAVCAGLQGVVGAEGKMPMMPSDQTQSTNSDVSAASTA